MTIHSGLSLTLPVAEAKHQHIIQRAMTRLGTYSLHFSFIVLSDRKYVLAAGVNDEYNKRAPSFASCNSSFHYVLYTSRILV
jgi:hypothetical protein